VRVRVEIIEQALRIQRAAGSRDGDQYLQGCE
jgi:hypothetical protein